MRLKASNKAFKKYLIKNWGTLNIPIVGGGKKVLEGMEQEELEKRLKIEPCEDKAELDFILDIKKKYAHLSKELKTDLIKIRIGEARELIQLFMGAIENLKTDYKDLCLDDYKDAKRKDSGQEFLKAMECFWNYSNGWLEEELFLLSGCDISDDMDWDEFENGVPEMLEIYKEMLEEILLDSTDKNKTTELQQEKPGYIKGMIEKGLLFPDGTRVITSIESIIEYLEDNNVKYSLKSLQDTFRKPDGTIYADKTIKNVMALINTEPTKVPKQYQYKNWPPE